MARIAELEQEQDDKARQEFTSYLAHKYNLPPALAARITGATDEEREVDAKALAQAYHDGRPSAFPRSRPGGGLSPYEKPRTATWARAFERAREGQRRGSGVTFITNPTGRYES
ncbi:hypothetical protein [Streptomyces cavernicola]|uniref:Uncharacterized protein n=1 Tax=Streptomyces cavernicola TaxID=3043613 RepID=A0ABT6SJQ1_9ACTN|nr:hypothetical protein [Streptomyces sp. B-S-A6]MDI3408421.1 hypothetical protein [Streptomyces sp. B-S-A6]